MKKLKVFTAHALTIIESQNPKGGKYDNKEDKWKIRINNESSNYNTSYNMRFKCHGCGYGTYQCPTCTLHVREYEIN